MTTEPVRLGVFRGITGNGVMIGDFLGKPVYPYWLYKDGDEPFMVHDSVEEAQAKSLGFDAITPKGMSNRYLVNWFWDLEDMSPRQLQVFAKEEYDVDIPIEAGQERLFKAVCELTRFAPQNKNRLVLMAHTIKMQYDETLEEIRRMVLPDAAGVECETVSFEVEI